MERRQAVALSATAHGGLLVSALIAGLLHARPPEDNLSVAAVSVISTSEFDALVSAAPADPQPPAPATPVDPPLQETAPPPPTDAPAPEPAPRPDTPAPATPDVVPEAIAPPPPVEAVTPDVPDQPDEPPADAAEAPDAPVSDTPAPRAADIVSTAPTPAPPPPLVETAPVVQAAPSPVEQAEPVEPAEAPAAPEQTAPVIVREDEVASAAPERSIRPDRRPARPVPAVASPQVQAEVPAAVAPAETAEKPREIDTNAALAAALAESEPAPAPPAPSGPPLTYGERDGIRVAFGRNWNIGSLSMEARRTTVTISVEFNRDGTARTDTIRLVGFSGGSEASAQAAFDVGRRAIALCGSDCNDLPPEKYEQWKTMELTFNPEKMALR